MGRVKSCGHVWWVCRDTPRDRCPGPADVRTARGSVSASSDLVAYPGTVTALFTGNGNGFVGSLGASVAGACGGPRAGGAGHTYLAVGAAWAARRVQGWRPAARADWAWEGSALRRAHLLEPHVLPCSVQPVTACSCRLQGPLRTLRRGSPILLAVSSHEEKLGGQTLGAMPWAAKWCASGVFLPGTRRHGGRGGGPCVLPGRTGGRPKCCFRCFPLLTWGKALIR